MRLVHVNFSAALVFHFVHRRGVTLLENILHIKTKIIKMKTKLK